MPNIYFEITSETTDNPIRTVLEKVAEAAGWSVTENTETADVVVTDSNTRALTLLKENDEITVVRLLMHSEQHDMTGALSLKKNFRDRVEICLILEEEVAETIHIITYLQQRGTQ